MTDRVPYPDLEAVVVELLSDLAATGTTTPPDLQTAMPFVRVQRYGGQDDRVTDAALVAVDAFAAVRSDAYALAESVRQRLISGPHQVGSAVVDAATTATGPNEVPWSSDQTVRRFAAAYRVTARR